MNYLNINKQTGFSLVSALFILIVLSLLGTYMVTISGTQQQTTNYALSGARAYQAARSGIEWGIYQTINNHDCSAFPKTIDFSDDGLNGLQTEITCSLSSHQEQSNSFNIYYLNSLAQTDTNSFGDMTYVSREIKITLTDTTP